MTDTDPPLSPLLVSEEDLLRKLDRWRQRRITPPTLGDVLEARDGELFAAFILEGFRAATAQAVLDRLELAASRGLLASAADSGSAAYRVFRGITRAWSLSDDEQAVMLGLADFDPQRALHDNTTLTRRPALLERLAILLDIFEAINTLLPVEERADAWIRRANRAALFEGRSALDLMLQGLEEMRSVRAYLQAEVRG